MNHQVELKVSAGPMKDKVFTFAEHDTFIFGRMDDCHCCLPDDIQVSRHHFFLEVNPPDARIRDLGSMNGTWVNGKKIGARAQGETPEEGLKRQYQEVVLKDGDEIQAGHTTLKVRVAIAEKAREPLLCKRCRKDVRAEVGEGRVGEYLCAECRKSIAQDPVAQIVGLLERAGGDVPGCDGPIPIRGYEIKRKLGEGGFGAVYLAEKIKTASWLP